MPDNGGNRALIVTSVTDVHHDWRATTPALKELPEDTDRELFQEWVDAGEPATLR